MSDYCTLPEHQLKDILYRNTFRRRNNTSFAILSVTKRGRPFRIVAPLANETALMEELQVDTQSLDESFSILLVNEKTEIVSNSGTSR